MIDDLATQSADLDSHHIEGIAYHGNTPFSIPLITQVVGNLWVGGCIDGVRLPDDFHYVLSLYSRERYAVGDITECASVHLYDAARIPDPEVLLDAARLVNRWRAQGKTLVHCQAGLNRSNLIAGLALILDGMDPSEAIALLRSTRSPAVLCNRTFENWLLTQGQE